jgi:hypothetical protein
MMTPQNLLSFCGFLALDNLSPWQIAFVRFCCALSARKEPVIFLESKSIMSRRHNKPHTENITSSRATGTNTHPTPEVFSAENPDLNPIVERAIPHFEAGHYEKALNVLAGGGSIPSVQNARGVCLMRLGRYEDAVRLYRGLVLQAGGTWARADVPALHKTNLATALLLHGHPSGCLSVLEEIGDPTYPPAIRLRQALAKWQSTLGFLQKLNWWFGRIEPPHCKVTLDFPPGDVIDNYEPLAAENSPPMNAYPPAVEQR